MPVTIFSRPDWADQATSKGNPWTEYLEQNCPTEIIDLYKEKAVRGPNEEAIKANPTAFYYGFGHGSSDVFTGQSKKIIMDASNVALWKDAWTHLLSCSVFAKLGKLLPWGSGYNRTFYFYAMSNPPLDDVSKMYFDSDHAVPHGHWADKTRGETLQAWKARFDYWFKNGPAYGKDYLPWDRDSAVMMGDPNARPTPAEGIKSLKAYWNGVAPENLIGDMKPVQGQEQHWEIPWKVPAEGTYKLIYVGEDTEGGVKQVETGTFNVKFPPSGINIIPASPVGGETFTARELKLEIRAWYEKP